MLPKHANLLIIPEAMPSSVNPRKLIGAAIAYISLFSESLVERQEIWSLRVLILTLQGLHFLVFMLLLRKT